MGSSVNVWLKAALVLSLLRTDAEWVSKELNIGPKLVCKDQGLGQMDRAQLQLTVGQKLPQYLCILERLVLCEGMT